VTAYPGGVKVVVVGGSGFIGTRLVSELLERGHDVLNVDLAASSVHAERTVIGDVRDTADLAGHLEGADVVINLAAEHRDDVRPVERYHSVNVGGAESLVAAADKAGVMRFVFTSTVAVYGLGRPTPDETAPLQPFNDYGITKKGAEEVLRAWAELGDGRSVLVLRPCVVFGEGNRGNVWTLASQIGSGRFVMVGNGQNRKSMAYVGNVVAFVAGQLTGEPGVRTLNYADKPDLPAKELVAIIKQRLGKPATRFSLPRPLGMVIGKGFDGVARVTGKSLPISAIRVEKFCAETTVDASALEATGFQRPFSLLEGVHRTLDAEFPS
jgi:nucleoside-diphosphate-sugar epimerase